MIRFDFKFDGALASDEYKRIILSELEAAMMQAVHEAEAEVVRLAKEKGLYNTGQLVQSIIGTVVSPTKGRVGVQPPGAVYAEVMELGRRAGQTPPPVWPLFRWTWLKLRIRPRKEAMSAAFAISKSIGKKGIIGRHYFREAEQKVKRSIEMTFSRAKERIEVRLSG